MARRGYPPEFRRRVVDVVEGGRKVSEVAAELEVSEQTIYTWRRQARIDAGLESGLSTAEHADLAAAKRRIRELETEVAIWPCRSLVGACASTLPGASWA